jgi:hypothetical protein
MVMDRGRRGRARQRGCARLAVATDQRVFHQRPEPRDANGVDRSRFAASAGRDSTASGGTTHGFTIAGASVRGERESVDCAGRRCGAAVDGGRPFGNRPYSGRRKAGRSEADSLGCADVPGPRTFRCAGAFNAITASTELEAGHISAGRATGASCQVRSRRSNPSAGCREGGAATDRAGSGAL